MIALVPVLLCAFLPTSLGDPVYGSSIHNSRFDCTGKPDGVAEIGCDGKLECVSGQVVKTYCGDQEFFDRNTMSCIATPGNTIGCTMKNICIDKVDGSYPDLDNNCQTYYTCHSHLFFGHQYCPGGLVFNQLIGICDWANHVPFPCGTLTTTVVG